MNQPIQIIDLSTSVYQRLLSLYPKNFRTQFGEEMLQVFSAKSKDTYKQHGKWGLFVFQIRVFFDLISSTVREHFSGSKRMQIFKPRSLVYLLLMLGLFATFNFTYTHWDKFPYPFPAPRNVINNTIWAYRRIENFDEKVFLNRESAYLKTQYMLLRPHIDLKKTPSALTPGRTIDHSNISENISIRYGFVWLQSSEFFAATPTDEAIFFRTTMTLNAWQAWTPLYTALFPLLWAACGTLFTISRRFSFWQKFSNTLILVGSAGLGVLQFIVLYTGILEPIWLWFSFSTILLSIGLVITGILTVKESKLNLINSFPLILAGLLLAQDYLRYNVTLEQAVWTSTIVVLFTITNTLWAAWGIATLRTTDEAQLKEILFAN